MAQAQQPQITEAHATQPASSPQMSMFLFFFVQNRLSWQPALTKLATAPPKKEEGFLRSTSEAYVKGAAKQAGEQTAQYESTNGQQQLDAAKAEAQVCRHSILTVETGWIAV